MGLGERCGYAADLECMFVRPHADIHMDLISGGFSRGLFYNTKLISSKKNPQKNSGLFINKQPRASNQKCFCRSVPMFLCGAHGNTESKRIILMVSGRRPCMSHLLQEALPELQVLDIPPLGSFLILSLSHLLHRSLSPISP